MERKHQVFVSSTYKDLIEERRHVIHALLELDCIPAGMELFPATDEDAWTLIKEVIDNSDYYLLIIAGKYGSTNAKGTSYTEMEYDYAVSIDKPIMCFLHKDIGILASNKTEKKEKLQSKLEEFTKKVQSKHCNFWISPEDLGGKVSRSLVQLKKKHPSDGWIPGKYAADEKLFRTLETLRAKIDELEIEKKEMKESPPAETENLAQGDELYTINVNTYHSKIRKKEKTELSVSWNRIFSYVGSSMLGECNDDEFLYKIQLAYYHSLSKDLIKHNGRSDLIIKHVNIDAIKIQLQALGLITHGSKKRTVSDKNTYWKLTPYGQKYLLEVSAIKSSKDISLF